MPDLAPPASPEAVTAAFRAWATRATGRTITYTVDAFAIELLPNLGVMAQLLGAGCHAVDGALPEWRIAEAVTEMNAECERRAKRPMYSVAANGAELTTRFIAALLAGRPAPATSIDAIEDRFNRVYVLGQAGTRAQALAAFRAAIADAKAGRL